MKRKLQFIISASAASFVALSTLAQDAPNPDRLPGAGGSISSIRRADRLNGAEKASDLIGMTVKNYQDEKLGKVEDFGVDVVSGRIVQVIITTGGFVGIDDTLSAVPPGALHHDVTQKVLHLNADKEKLKTAPKFEMTKWTEYSDSNHLYQVYLHYGEQPYFVASEDMKWISSTDAKRYAALPRNLDGTINVGAARAMENVKNAEIARKVEETTPATATVNPAWPRLGYVEKASKLIGVPVKNLQDEKIGKVENLAVDLAAGRIVAIIVSSGGFLGIGNELSAVPPTALQFNANRDTLQLDASKESLSAAPHFKSSEWPDLSQPTYAVGVYRAYKVEPYFTTDADNTSRNERDRDDRTLTPLNQGTSKADVNTTAQIRKEIMAAKNMSVNAQNVKVITIDGRVTLRGPVATAEEKRLIGEIANRLAPSGNVDNQLEVKLSTSSKEQ